MRRSLRLREGDHVTRPGGGVASPVQFAPAPDCYFIAQSRRIAWWKRLACMGFEGPSG
jgi:hypothetical protein